VSTGSQRRSRDRAGHHQSCGEVEPVAELHTQVGRESRREPAHARAGPVNHEVNGQGDGHRAALQRHQPAPAAVLLSEAALRPRVMSVGALPVLA
jgi:hypothetical protein